MNNKGKLLPNHCLDSTLKTMQTHEYRTLYNLIRRYQLEDCKLGGKVYDACDLLLRELFPYYYNQNQQQKR
jgi:hypothetical protein